MYYIASRWLATKYDFYQSKHTEFKVHFEINFTSEEESEEQVNMPSCGVPRRKAGDEVPRNPKLNEVLMVPSLMLSYENSS